MCLKTVTLSCSLIITAAPVAASCLGSGNTKIAALAKDVGRKPFKVLQQIELQLKSDSSMAVETRAWLEATRANAQRMTGMNKLNLPQALEQAMRLPKNHPALLQLQIASLYGQELKSIQNTIKTLKSQLDSLPDKQPAALCLKVRLASVMADYNTLNGESFELAADAYRHANVAGLEWVRAEAASVLGQVALRTDSGYARQLSREALQYFKSQQMHDMVANELYMVALSYIAEREELSLKQAAQQLLGSKAAALRAENKMAVAYAEAGLCEVEVQLGQIQAALQTCALSLELIKGDGNVTKYNTLINYAEALMQDQQLKKAVAILQSLSRSVENRLTGYKGYRFHFVRGKLYAAQGRNREAIADLLVALERLKGYESNIRARSNRLFQSRFHVEQLEQSLKQSELESKRKEQRNNLIVLASFTVVTLLSIIVIILVRHRRMYRFMAFTDPLTGLPNRRFTRVRAEDAINNASARGKQLCIALLDLDKFKSCNDQYGHDAGDQALQSFAKVAKGLLRPGDILGRWGGEEFLLILEDTNTEQAFSVLDRIRVGTASISLTLAPEYPVQFSAGVAELSPNLGLDALLSLADEALYRAKEQGRNQDQVAPSLADKLGASPS